MKRKHRRIRTLDIFLGISIAVLVAYTIATLAIFAVTGQEPSVLTGCVFGAFAGEIWACAWIKKLKLQNEVKLRKEQEEIGNDSDAVC